MKTPLNLILLLSAVFQFSFAQESSLVSAIEDLPPCALQCLTTAIEESRCELTNQTCICTNSQLQASVETCALQSCTIKEGLITKNITMTVCNAPVRTKTEYFRVINITLGVISVACVILRLVYKGFVTTHELGLDDWFILLLVFGGVPSTIISDLGTSANGLGKDIWTLPPQQITNFIRFFYVNEVLYFLQVALLKLSLLFFYYRIFPGAPVRRAIMATVIFNVLYGIVFVIVAIFQCRPISFYWHSWDGEHSGTCINVNALAWANAAISIVLDIWMLAIPLSQLIHLQLAWKRKVGVALMFIVGTFVTVVSILRLQSLVNFANSKNPTWDQWEVMTWSTVEINVGIICACMPAIRVILVRLFPRVFGSTQAASNQQYAKYGSRNPDTPKYGLGSKGAGKDSKGGSQIGPANKLGDITYTKTFELDSGEGGRQNRGERESRWRDTDEVRLVEMDDLSGKEVKEAKSGNSSQVSL